MGTLQVLPFPVSERPGREKNDSVLSISEGFRTGASPSGCLVSYTGHSLGWGWGLNPLQKYNWCILVPELTKRMCVLGMLLNCICVEVAAQGSWGAGEKGLLLHYHYSHVSSELEYYYTLRSHLCVKYNTSIINLELL